MTSPAESSTPFIGHVYRVFLASSITVAAVAVVFFFVGLADGSVSSFNIALWVVLLAVVLAAPAAGRALRTRGRSALAVLVLGITAVPGFVGALFLLIVLVTHARWN